MKLAVCTGCGRRATASPDKRCDGCRLPSRPRGNAFEPTRQQVFRAARGICHLCGEPVKPGEEWHVDHVHPRSRRGADSLANYALAHKTCNLKKGNR